MLQSWLLGLSKLLERGSGQLTLSSKHQCVSGLFPSPTAAVAALGAHIPRKSCHGGLLSLQGTKNEQLQLPSFRLNQSFCNFSTALSSSALSA